MSALPPSPFITVQGANVPVVPPDDDHRFILDEAAFLAAVAPEPGARHDDFAKVNRLLEELADTPPARRLLEEFAEQPPMFIADPSQAYLRATEAGTIEPYSLPRRAAAG